MGKNQGRVKFGLLWATAALLVAACSTTTDDVDDSAAGGSAAGDTASDDGGVGGASPHAITAGGAGRGGAGGIAGPTATQGGAGRGGADADVLSEAGSLTSCPGNLCGDGDIYALGRACRAEGLLCDDNQAGAPATCAVMQCCAGVWVYADAAAPACPRDDAGNGGNGGQGGGR